MRRGRYPGQPRFPFVPGYDVVGTVTEVGVGVDPALVGQRVAAITKTGGWASHVILPARDLLPVPEDLDVAEVETLVVNGITAWQLLHRIAKVQPGQVILVHGANGGVGTTLAQLARQHGVRVLGAAHPRHHASLRSLGVEPVDYTDPAAMDTTSGRWLRRCRRRLRQSRWADPAAFVASASARRFPGELLDRLGDHRQPDLGIHPRPDPPRDLEHRAQWQEGRLLQHLGRSPDPAAPLPRPSAERPHRSPGPALHRCAHPSGRRPPPPGRRRRGAADRRVAHQDRQGCPSP